MKNKFIILFFLASTFISAQTVLPKFEMRGVWMASLGIDWPSSTGTSASVISSQKSQLVSLFDSHKAYGLNAIFFHIRPLCDAVYKSSYEPWSRFLTGTQGAAPSDASYDPLKFAIDEAHKRGMELHAWLNPYRALQTTGTTSTLSPNHIINTKPEWIIKCTGTEYRFLNPGLPQVREYVTKIVMDIVRRYDVDGIHFDDYFYPYTEYGPFNDDAAFQQYPYGFTDKAAWRKNNVNLLIKMLNDSIKAVRPHVKFGISPSGNPSVNNAIFCSPADWLKGDYRDTSGVQQTGPPYIDNIIPQLYWVGYNGLLGQWSTTSFLNGRELFVGLPAYRYLEAGWTPSEISWEMKTNRSTPTVKGGVFFSSRSLINNLAGCNDSLKYNYYVRPSVTPKMTWYAGSSSRPNPPTNLRYELSFTSGKYELEWDKPTTAPNGDSAISYLVYRFTSAQGNPENPENIFGTTGELYLNPSYAKYSVTQGDYYAVSAFNRFSNESVLSNIVYFDPAGKIPAQPILASPANGTSNLQATANLSWNSVPNAERYHIQISYDADFNQIIFDIPEYRSSSLSYPRVVPGFTYYWRVRAVGVGGGSNYSTVFMFKSGIPTIPLLLEPPHASLTVPRNPTLKWSKIGNATSYKFQLATNNTFVSPGVIVDTTLTDTTIYVQNLDAIRNHFWRVAAVNSLGTSSWSTVFGFKTTSDFVNVKDEAILVYEYNLNQNYPNPFNPSTVIKYGVGSKEHVVLKVFDILGNEVATLINESKEAGIHQVEFSANKTNLNSGVYFYQLRAGSYIVTKKMLLVK